MLKTKEMQKRIYKKTWQGQKEQFWRTQLGILVYNMCSELKSLFKNRKKRTQI
jgi:hypothetical protein